MAGRVQHLVPFRREFPEISRTRFRLVREGDGGASASNHERDFELLIRLPFLTSAMHRPLSKPLGVYHHQANMEHYFCRRSINLCATPKSITRPSSTYLRKGPNCPAVYALSNYFLGKRISLISTKIREPLSHGNLRCSEVETLAGCSI